MNPILIVDDEVEMRIAMSETLKHCGYPVETSHNAIDALNKVKKNNYAMVITDMRMPNMTGLELLEKIKADYPKLPVVMISGYSVSSIHSDVDGVKPDGFLAKPFLMSDIEQLVNMLL